MISVLLFVALSAFAAEDSKLVKALNQGDIPAVTKLAKDKKELNWKDESGNDALFYAVSLNDEKAVDVLLKAGASAKETYGDKKESLLFEAARLGGKNIAENLIKKDKALLKQKSTDGESPVFAAVREGQTEMITYFSKLGLSVKEKNKSGKIPSDYANPKDTALVELLKTLSK